MTVVPQQYRNELETLSKDMLIEIVWDLACADENPIEVIRFSADVLAGKQ